MKKFAIATMIVLVAMLFTGTAMAATPIPATTETQGITTATNVVVSGLMTNAETVVMTTSNQDIRNNPPLNEYDPTWLDFGFVQVLVPFVQHWNPESQATFSYTESILADNGYSEFNEVQSVDTANKVMNQDNFNSVEHFDYISHTDAFGRATTHESTLLDLVSQGSDATEEFLCPFATGDDGYIPPYCNTVEMGSSFTGNRVSMVTQTDTNFIAKSADVPTQTSYTIDLSGSGSVASWINVHTMEGRTGDVADFGFELGGPGGFFTVWTPAFYNPDMEQLGFMQGSDVIYKEKTTASGAIESFSKSMSYTDATRRV